MGYFSEVVALVTGAGSGLGRELALHLGLAGAKVAAVDLNPEPLAALAGQMGNKPFAWAVGDVTDRAGLHKAVREVTKKLGPVDLLIANAGIGFENSALSFRAEDFETQIRVNLIGVANSVETVLPGMIERRRGHVAAISSLASYRGLPKMLGYCASKSGVNALLEGLRVELKPHGIAVTTICPGWIKTALTANVDVPASQMLEVADAADRILLALSERRPYFAFPRSGVRQVRMLRWLPCGLSDWLTTRRTVNLTKKDAGTTASVPMNESAAEESPLSINSNR
jgi:NAD(P)-dependent dehydrogenase (short-subunit alcohol dehydrogenase family)